MQKKIKMRSNPEILRLLWDITVFRFVSYLLIMICLILQMNTKLHIYEFSDKFDSIFFTISLRQEHQIDVLSISLNN